MHVQLTVDTHLIYINNNNIVNFTYFQRPFDGYYAARFDGIVQLYIGSRQLKTVGTCINTHGWKKKVNDNDTPKINNIK